MFLVQIRSLGHAAASRLTASGCKAKAKNSGCMDLANANYLRSLQLTL